MWKPVEEAPVSKKMIVVKAVGVDIGGAFPYNSDPYCSWQFDKGEFAR